MAEGGYDPVRRYARVCRQEEPSIAQAYMPLSFAPGEVCQFDRSHEVVPIDGMTVTVKMVPVRLCHSRMPFVWAYPRESLGMWCSSRRGICDTMKMAVDTRIAGKERVHNRRFPQMCSHHPVDPVACSPAWGWEQREVENRVGLVCERVFAPAAGDELR